MRLYELVVDMGVHILAKRRAANMPSVELMDMGMLVLRARTDNMQLVDVVDTRMSLSYTRRTCAINQLLLFMVYMGMYIL